MLVENGNVDKLAHVIISFIQSPSLITMMGQAARKNVRRFDIRIVADRWMRLFDDLVG